jgi:UDP-N-acetyl-D-glucosamine dehydrogenase
VSKVAVIGQGIVGRSLSDAIARSEKHSVIGIDVNQALVQSLSDTVDYPVSSDYSDIKSSDILVVCVPTVVAKPGLPSSAYVFNAIKSISKNIKDGALVIIESTVPIGTTRRLHRVLEESSKYFELAYSPERINVGGHSWNISNTPKIVSGITELARDRAEDFYKTFIDEVVLSGSVEDAEAAKLLENAYRLINISFINEYAMILDKLGINVNSVISLADTKPFGFSSFRPGLGAGGDCIPVDPTFILESTAELGIEAGMIDKALSVNDKAINYFISLAINRLGTVNNKKICIVGISYKPNVEYTTNSQGLELLNRLNSLGANTYWHDDVVKKYRNTESQNIDSKTDLVIVVHRHDGFDTSILNNMQVIDCERI